jgi:hypothetical protein
MPRQGCDDLGTYVSGRPKGSIEDSLSPASSDSVQEIALLRVQLYFLNENKDRLV